MQKKKKNPSTIDGQTSIEMITVKLFTANFEEEKMVMVILVKEDGAS